jgi:hypothetical protein
MKPKIIIAGGRDFRDRDRMVREIGVFDQWRGGNAEIVSGGAHGADKMGEWLAETWGFDLTVMDAEWSIYGKGAGFMRNTQMAGYADVLIAFWDGKSKGTKHMIDTALTAGLEVHVYRY